MRSRRCLIALMGAILICSTAFAAAKQDTAETWTQRSVEFLAHQPARIAMNNGVVSWQPQISFSQATFTVAGASGVVYHEQVASGGTVAYNFTTTNGSPLADGVYSYELRFKAPQGAATSDVPLVLSGQFKVNAGTPELLGIDKALTSPAPNSVSTQGDLSTQGDVSAQFTSTTDPYTINGKVVIGAEPLFGAGELELYASSESGINTIVPANIVFINADSGGNITSNNSIVFTDAGFRFGPTNFGDVSPAYVFFSRMAPANSLYIASSGNVGLGTSAPTADLDIFSTNATLNNRVFVKLRGSTFAPQFEYTDGNTSKTWRIGMNPSDDFVINQTDDLNIAEMKITADGHVYVNNSQVHPDYVFAPDYKLMGLDELASYVKEKRHLPGLASSDEAKGETDLSSFPLDLLKKIEELTLYTIDQQKTISEQGKQIAQLQQEKDTELAKLRAQVEALQKAVAEK